MKKISIERLQDLETIENVEEIYLFGSVARGDDDEYSDVDILIIINECTDDEYIEYKEQFANILEVPLDWISLYKESKIRKMYDNGSYFLWHIKKEGIRLFSRCNKLNNLLKTLPKYKGIKEDLEQYLEILNDVKKELESEDICVNYELAVLASLVRNTCIAIAYLNNRYDFGRESVIISCIEEYPQKIKFTLREYNELYKYRLFQKGKLTEIAEGSREMLKTWMTYELQLLELALEGVETYGKGKKS